LFEEKVKGINTIHMYSCLWLKQCRSCIMN
jgi:hypothetical protein